MKMPNFFSPSLDDFASVTDLRSTLLHNDITSENLFEVMDGMQAFDFGFAAVGHPMMDMSLTHSIFTACTKESYLDRWHEFGKEIEKRELYSLSAQSLVIRLLLVLNALNNARKDEK